MFNIGPLELMVILVIALLVVGPKRLPEVTRSIGRGLREFRKAQEEVQKTLELSLDEEPPPQPKTGTVASTELAEPTEPIDAGLPGAAPAAVSEEASAQAAPAAAEQGAEDVDPGELARHIGRGLAELRRAREEIQRSFRVDLDEEDAGARPPRPAPTGPPTDQASADQAAGAEAE